MLGDEAALAARDEDDRHRWTADYRHPWGFVDRDEGFAYNLETGVATTRAWELHALRGERFDDLCEAFLLHGVPPRAV